MDLVFMFLRKREAQGEWHLLHCWDFFQRCCLVFLRACWRTGMTEGLLDPAYKATVSDLLTADEYSKASGLVSLAGSARYLVSPVIAGILLSVSDVKLLLVMISSLLTLFIGVFQILAEPLILSVADAKTLGIAETICASGMLVSSLYLGMRGIKTGHVRILSLSLALAGVCILGFGILKSIMLITLSGFGFFMMLPFANNCLDFLVRTNTPMELQGRVWGIVGFMSQIGYVIAYGCSGFLADRIAEYRGISVGRGAGMVISFAGVALMIVSVSILFMKDIKFLEENKGGGKEI